MCELSDEEKNAIEELRKLPVTLLNCHLGGSVAINTVLNLIEKQSKEIEERETRLQEEINENCKLKSELYGNSISKDKIKEIIYGDYTDLGIIIEIRKLIEE